MSKAASCGSGAFNEICVGYRARVAHNRILCLATPGFSCPLLGRLVISFVSLPGEDTQSKRSKNERTAVARESSRRSGSPFLLKILGREMLRCEWSGSGERTGIQMLRVYLEFALCTKTLPLPLTPEIEVHLEFRVCGRTEGQFTIIKFTTT